MGEFEVRKLTKEYISKKIEDYIHNYALSYKQKIGYLVYYPLIAIEYRFKKDNPDHQTGAQERFALSWFIGELFKKGINFDLRFEYNEQEFQDFMSEHLNEIKDLYHDFNICEEVMDMNSIAKSEFKEIENNKYLFTTALVEGGLNKEYIYYHGLYNEDFKREEDIKTAPSKKLWSNYYHLGNRASKKIKRLLIDIDMELLELTNECVKVDLSKLGGNVKSTVINNVKDLNSIISFYYYCSIIVHASSLMKESSPSDAMIIHDKAWFINKASVVTGLSTGKVEKYLSYFLFEGKGSILEFPFIQHKNKIIYIPSSWILNDLHFCIVNGHYYKDVKFKNRDKTISHSVVSSIINQVQHFRNIVFGQEVYYEFPGEKNRSDVDVALYDRLSNTCIIVESKWKENHYTRAGEENFQKINASLNEIYNTQISKHRTFINNDKNKLSYILENKINSQDIPDNPDILYIAVDKRSELYIDDKILVSLYGLMALIKSSSNGDILYLDRVIDILRKQKTKSEYINIGDFQEISITDNIKIVTEDLNSYSVLSEK